MRYLALCTDYDGTLATDGRLLPETIAALERLRASGRRIVLVTGRELDDLQSVCSRLDLFDYVVAENGALLYQPSRSAETPLAQRPPDAFVVALRARGIPRVSVGRVIVATWEPYELDVLETIKDQGLELQVIFNKGAVMILPAGVNKATGLTVALTKLGLSPHNAVGIGDAENDHALLALCECGVAVANALPRLKETADFVTTGDHGAGVTELIDAMLRDDLSSHESALTRHHLDIGWDRKEQPLRVRPYGEHILLLGPPGSHVRRVTSLLNRLAQARYSFCVIDSEGRYGAVQGAVQLGSDQRPPGVQEALQALGTAPGGCVINISGARAEQRTDWIAGLTSGLEEMARRSGQPHWVVVEGDDDAVLGPGSVVRVTERPGRLPAGALRSVSLVMAAGPQAVGLIEEFGRAAGVVTPHMDPMSLREGEALALGSTRWGSGRQLFVVCSV